MNKFSVAMAVYRGDNPEHFKLALESVYNQTAPPDEVVLVVDGPVSSDTEEVINFFLSQKDNLKVKRLERNMGHAAARRAGLELCSNELVALMDADDISLPHRFAEQLSCFEQMDDVSVLGSLIAEFSEESAPDLVRKVPERDGEIKKYLKSRCPFNQVSVMLKKSEAERAGGYLDWYHNEDYYLWIRMCLNGAGFYNLQKVLVYARAGKALYERRGGWAYFVSEYRLQKYMLQKELISPLRFFANIGIRFAVQVVMPNRLRTAFFRRFAREKGE
jgi:glycosyltransferase involved in cell wall biosynthesis